MLAYLNYFHLFNKKYKTISDTICETIPETIDAQSTRGTTVDDPLANRKAQADVESAFMKWERFRLVQDASQADLVIGVRKGTGKNVNPTINGGPVDSAPVAIDTTDKQIRVIGQQGRPPDVTQPGAQPGTNGPNDRTHTGMEVEVGAKDDTFEVFQGGVQYPVDSTAVWKYIAKDGLKPPRCGRGGPVSHRNREVGEGGTGEAATVTTTGAEEKSVKGAAAKEPTESLVQVIRH